MRQDSTVGDPKLDLGWMLQSWPDGMPGSYYCRRPYGPLQLAEPLVPTNVPTNLTHPGESGL